MATPKKTTFPQVLCPVCDRETKRGTGNNFYPDGVICDGCDTEIPMRQEVFHCYSCPNDWCVPCLKRIGKLDEKHEKKNILQTPRASDAAITLPKSQQIECDICYEELDGHRVCYLLCHEHVACNACIKQIMEIAQQKHKPALCPFCIQPL